MQNTSNNYILQLKPNFPTGGVPPYTYQWTGPNVSGATSTTYSVVNYGTYNLVVTDANGCEQISDPIVFNPTGVLDAASLTNIQIYPNPFNEETTLDFGRVVDKVEIRIFDVLGKLLEEYSLKEVETFKIEREGKVDGVYFIEVEIDEVEWFNKIVLE